MEKQLIVNFEKLEKFVGRQKTALVGSVDSDGVPNIKAMLLAKKRDGLKAFYFSTNTSSMRVKQFRENAKASIYFYRKGLVKYEGVMLKGVMEVLEDDGIKRELWQRGDKVFYPLGVTDPDYCILKFTAKEGRYYCNLKTESFPV
jgi:general stress protein 26